MAASYNSLLRTLCAFLLFSSLARFYCHRRPIFKDLNYCHQAGLRSLDHPTPDNFKCFYINVSFHFKRRPPSDKLSLPISKIAKHGLITLALPRPFFDIDLTVYMDVHSNPGPDLENSSFHRPTFSDRDLHITATSERVNYSRQQLLDLRARSKLQPDLYQFLKFQGILRTRRTRAGKSMKQSCGFHRISPLWKVRKPSIVKFTAGANLNNLVTIKRHPLSSTSANSLNFCLLNARSINNKTLQIKDYVVDKKIDIFALTETWLKPDDCSDYIIRDISPTGYAFVHTPRPDGNGGGVGLLYRKNLKMEQIKSDPCKSFEFKELLLHSSASIIRIIIIYRPPISAKNGLTHVAFFDDFSSLLERLVSSPDHLLLAGDFNFHVNNSSDNTANKFLDLLNCFNLEVSNVCTPTHKSNNVLDLLITRSGEATVLNLSVNDPVISDHFAVHCNLAIKRPPKAKLPSHHVNCAPLIQTIYGVIFVPPPYTTHRRTKLRTSAISMTRFYLQSWINMHLCAQGSSPYGLMLLGIVRKSENKNQPAASLRGAGDAPNLNQTIDTMQINALLFGISFSSQKWVTTLISFRRLAKTTKPCFVQLTVSSTGKQRKASQPAPRLRISLTHLSPFLKIK